MGTSKATGMIRDVSDLVEVVMGCSSSEADRVGAAICRSPEAAQKLGYTNVQHFKPGISGWKAAGEATEK
jgi:rhodanese-related sulfurtransferase